MVSTSEEEHVENERVSPELSGDATEEENTEIENPEPERFMDPEDREEMRHIAADIDEAELFDLTIEVVNQTIDEDASFASLSQMPSLIAERSLDKLEPVPNIFGLEEEKEEDDEDNDENASNKSKIPGASTPVFNRKRLCTPNMSRCSSGTDSPASPAQVLRELWKTPEIPPMKKRRTEGDDPIMETPKRGRIVLSERCECDH